jgi:hypothetical protein
MFMLVVGTIIAIAAASLPINADMKKTIKIKPFSSNFMLLIQALWTSSITNNSYPCSELKSSLKQTMQWFKGITTRDNFEART